MDSKEIKANLKEAREAIKNKDYRTAVKHCKVVLKADRNNYVGLVLFGAALQETEQKDQAVNAFKKAIEVSPTQLLAWQGLAAYYEKDDSEKNRKELVSVYKQLLELYKSDAEKFVETSNKLAQLALQLQDLELCVDSLKQQEDVVGRDKEKSTALWEKIYSILSQVQDLPPKHASLLVESMANIVNDSTTQFNEENFKKYLKLLYKHRKYDTLLEEARRMHSLFPKLVYPLEWICKVYNESVLDKSRDMDIFEDKIEDYYNKLLALNENSSMAALAKGSQLYKRKLIVEARDALMEAVRSMPTSYYAWSLLTVCHISLHNYCDAEYSALEGLKHVQQLKADDERRSHLEDILNSSLMKALCLQETEEKLNEGINLCKKALKGNNNNDDILVHMARAMIGLGKSEDTLKVLNALTNHDNHKSVVLLLKGFLLKKEGKTDEALNLIHSAVSTDANSAELWFELGKLQWHTQRHNESLMSFLKAAKLDPYCCTPFVYLADYYRLYGNDIEKARRCYQKAFHLNPRCVEAGCGLSDIYRQQGKEEANLQLLLSVTSSYSAATAKWAWLRLGLHYLAIDDPAKAISSLRSAIRADPNDSLCWESLADAYLARGAYTAALKSFQKVVELSPGSLYPTFQIATVKQILGLYDEAVVEFRELVKNNPKYVPALKGLGETSLCLAKNYLSQCLIGLTRDRCEEALNVLTSAARERSDMSCVWKLMGDACTLLVHMPASSAKLSVPPQLISTEFLDEVEPVLLGKQEVLELGARCYCRALNLLPENSFLWHDLALSYSHQADIAATAEKRKELRERSLAAAKKVVSINPRNCLHWNVLGVISASKEINNYSLAQHSFIKSIKYEKNNVIAWANLGTLYLCLDRVDLAHKAFKVAQRTEPSYIESWIGQALIAEMKAPDQAMDLFRHTTQLAIHPESCIGYSHWVCTTLLDLGNRGTELYRYNIERMHAVPAAADGMTWYTYRIDNNPCAFNMLGLLLERQKLYRGAAKAFLTCLALLEGTEHAALLDMVLSNYGRVLVQLGDYEEAIKYYQMVKEANFYTQCGLASAFFKAEKYEDSYDAYGTALEWLAPDDGQKSHVLVAMATMAYKFQGLDDAKTLLLQCSQLKPPSVPGLFSLCALGMLHLDLNLTKFVLKELVPYRDDPKYMTDVAMFQAYTSVLEQKGDSALRQMSTAVHRHPGQASLWLSLALLVLHLHPVASPSSGASCAEIALTLGRSLMDISKVMSLVSLSHLLSGLAIPSLKSSQKAVHLFPDIPENWVVLVASYLPWCVAHSSADGVLLLKKLIGHVRRRLEASRELGKWLSNYERKVTRLIDDYKKE